MKLGGVIAAALAVSLLNSCGSSCNGPACTIEPARFLYTADLQNEIWGYAIDATTGALTSISGSPFSALAPPPSYCCLQTMVISPSGKFIYVALYQGQIGNKIATFAIDGRSGAVTLVGSPIYTAAAPVGLSIDPAENFLYVAATHGSVSVYQINDLSGELTEIDGSPYLVADSVSSVALDPSGRFAYVAESNFANGTESGCPPSPSNPYTTCIAVFAIDSTSGALTYIPGSSIMTGGGAMIIDPSGKFAYVAASNGIVAYAIDPRSGVLSAIGGEPTASAPGPLAIDPFGRFIYATGANTISAYAIYLNGALKAVSSSPFPESSPFGIFSFDPTGRFVYYVANDQSPRIYGYVIDSVTGGLTPISGSPFAQGNLRDGTFPVAIGISTIRN